MKTKTKTKAKPIVAAFQRYRAWLAANIPELDRSFAGPAKRAELDAFETLVGRPFPASLRALWLACDGQLLDDLKGDEPQGAIAGYWLLSIRRARHEWEGWAKMRAKRGFKQMLSGMRSTPDDAIEIAYTHPGWVPVFQEPAEGNYIGVDLMPDTAGHAGQVINFGRDEEDKYVLAHDLTDVLQWLVDRAETGHIVQHPTEEEEDDDTAYILVDDRRLVYPLRDANLPGRPEE